MSTASPTTEDLIPTQRAKSSPLLSRTISLPTLSPRTGWILLALLALATAVVYSVLGVNRYIHLEDNGFDLGIFSQAVQSLAHGHAAAAPIDFKAHQNFFGDHFEPILYIPALLWLLFPSPITLIVLQALLVAASLPSIYLFVKRRWAVGPSLGVCLAYVSYWGMQTMALFDFHEVAFVVPITAIMLERADAGRFKTAALVALSLLLVKEDMTLTLAAFGILLALYYRQRLLGSAILLSGVGGFFLLIKLVVPAMLPSGKFVYFQKLYGDLGATPGEVMLAPVRHPLKVLSTLVHPSTKLHTLRDTFQPWFYLPLFSPLLLVGLPLLVERFLATRMGYWVVEYHYTAPLTPILALGFVDTCARIAKTGLVQHLTTRLSSALPRLSLGRIPAVLTGLVLVFSIIAVPMWSPIRFTTDSNAHFLSPLAGDAGCYQVMDAVPVDADVEASTNLSPHLVVKDTVWLPGEDPHHPQYLVESAVRGAPLASGDSHDSLANSAHLKESLLQSPSEVGAPEPLWIAEARKAGYTPLLTAGNCRLWKAPTS